MIVRAPGGSLVDLEVVEFLRGEWCDACLLPSAVAFTVAVTPPGLPTALQTATRCLDCGD